MKKAIFGMLFSLLVISLVTLSLKIQPAEAAAAAVYIRADGSVYPSTAPVQRSGNVYTLTGDIITDLDGIWIEKDNVVLDGAGHAIQSVSTGMYNNGIYMWERKNVVIKNLKIRWFYSGIYVYASSNISIIENEIKENSMDGIWFMNSKYMSISRNNITDNYCNGVNFYASSFCHISGNIISGNDYFGIEVSTSSQNSIIGNKIENNMYGLSLYGSSKNIAYGNTITGNTFGVCLESSSENVFHHNNFIYNLEQVYPYNSVNIWDDGYPSGGNYWSNYIGVDSDNDGIGDVPHIIDPQNEDNYPLMNIHQTTVYLYPLIINTQEGATFSVTITASNVQSLWAWQAGVQWDPSFLEFTSYTWGEFESFAGASEQSQPLIDEDSGKTCRPALESALRGWNAPVSTIELNLLTITFKALKPGAGALRLMEVSLICQNTSETTVYPRWSDVNGNEIVDSEDVTLTCTLWEENSYSQTTDFNDDGMVDITDIAIVTSDFGKSSADPEWGFTNTVYCIPTVTVDADVSAMPSAAFISVPLYPQTKGYYCGPADLQMVFAFYGPLISQHEIADVARTEPDPYGTFTCDMVRAAHFSDLSTSVGRELPNNITGYTARKLGYAAFEHGDMTIDDLKSLVAAGYPIIVLTGWHYRVVVGYNATHIITNDSLGPKFTNMTYSVFESSWLGWGLFVSPWKVELSFNRNVVVGQTFTITATITYPCPPPFPRDMYPATMVNATITLPDGLSLVPGEKAKKTAGTGHLEAGNSVDVTWTVQANDVGNFVVNVEAEGRIEGFVPSLPSDYPEYAYEDRIGGAKQGLVAVTLTPDVSPPTTTHDYDGLWHNQDFTINLAAFDENSGVMETYYRVNGGPVRTLSCDGQPHFTTSNANNTLEYWSVDWAGNEEPHNFLFEIKLDKTSPVVNVPSRTPTGNVPPAQEVKVTVNVTDAVSGVRSVVLSYIVIGDGITSENRTMHYNSITGLYEAVIPGQPNGSSVRFRIIAYDNADNVAVEDNSGKYYTYLVCEPLSVSIKPRSKSLYVEQSVKFTSIVTGGRAPYFYQWYLNGTPVSGEILDSWTFKPAESGTYYVFLRVTDSVGNTQQSEISSVTVRSRPVGGYSFMINVPLNVNVLSFYSTTTVVLTLFLLAVKRKRLVKQD